jgi:hypothetical protein
MVKIAPWFAAGGKTAWGGADCQSHMRAAREKMRAWRIN